MQRLFATIGNWAKATRPRSGSRNALLCIEIGKFALLPSQTHDTHGLAAGRSSGASAPAGVGPKPDKRLKIYVPHAARSDAARIGLPNSPSLGMSMPNFARSATISTTDFCGSAPSMTPCPGSLMGCDHASRSSCGRGKLPACVVKKRFTLVSFQGSFFKVPPRRRTHQSSLCRRLLTSGSTSVLLYTTFSLMWRNNDSPSLIVHFGLEVVPVLEGHRSLSRWTGGDFVD